jgi:hypothetical protein
LDVERKPGTGKDYFGDFLESVSRIQPSPGTPSTVPASPQTEAQSTAERQPPELSLPTVLAYLRAHNGVSVADLAAGLNSPIVQMADLVGKLGASGLLVVQGEPGKEQVQLTEAGVNLSSIA